MDIPILTFQDIIRLNDYDWDLAYSVLLYHLAKWDIVKEVSASDQVIYHNPIRVQSHNLIHKKIFSSEHIVTKTVMRPRGKHINPNGNDGVLKDDNFRKLSGMEISNIIYNWY